MLREIFFALTLGALLGGCSSPVAASSSSNHWIACAIDEDCTELPTATMCASGYCVDDKGARVGQSSSALRSCDPLTPRKRPVKLGTVWGVGRDDAGTTYLVDSYEVAGQFWNRVFVSDGNMLVRREIVPDFEMALGGLMDTGDWNRLEFDDGRRTLAIVVTRAFSQDHPEDFVTTDMSIGPPDATDGLIPLTLEDPSVISGFTLKNLTEPDRISALGYVDDGSVILVTRPTLEASDNDARVFWGRPDDVRERRLFTADFDFHRVLFDNGAGRVVTAKLTSSVEADGGLVTPATLTGPGISATIAWGTEPPEALPKDLSFSCRGGT
jgi:hypothetical protein